MALRHLALALLCFAFIYSRGVQSKNFELPQECLKCICEATSGCNIQKGCGNGICGPFHMTIGYWMDAGKPTINGQSSTAPGAFTSCATNLFCAEKAVTGYMQRYAQDCNFDGKIDCDDYARIHYLGGYGCSGELPRWYEVAYFNCKNRQLLA